MIFMMEKSQLNRVRRKFPDGLRDKQVVVLRIPDDYHFMQPELISEPRSRVARYLALPDAEKAV
jgi:predicted protein tyrosine phosphatase